MNLVDSCGWLEYFTDGDNADFFSFPLHKFDQLIVPSVCIYEVFKKVLRERGEGEALQVAAVMKQGLVVAFDDRLAMHAARLGDELKLPMADSIILATAQERRAMIWTQDEHFKDIPGVKFRSSRPAVGGKKRR